MEHNLSYHEVVPDQTLPDLWKEISLNTGGTQSTLQDIKVTERASGYSYKNSSNYFTRNRFIYWHINNDILELVEQSLDINLSGNSIRYKFVDTPILDGVSAHETLENIIILVPTVCSIHRLTFPHPNELHKQDEVLGSHPDLSVLSIFSGATSVQPRDPSTFFVFNHPTAHSQLPHLAASTLVENDAFFLLAYPTNEVVLIKQYENNECETVELKNESIVPRFLADFAGKFITKPTDNNVASMLLHDTEYGTYALTLTRDGYLRVWCCVRAICVLESEVLLEAHNKPLIQGAHNFMLKKSVFHEDDPLFAVHINSTNESKFFVLRLTVNENGCSFKIITYLSPPYNDLVDFSFTPTQIWTMWRGKDRESQVCSAKISTAIDRGVYWMPAMLEPLPDQQEVSFNSYYVDPKEAYLNYIFYPGRFPLSVINKALNIYKRSSILSDLNVSVGVLKQRVCMAVENEIQSTLQECEVNDEDYLECANNSWKSFYSCCIQYYITGLRPLGILMLPSVSGVVLLKRTMYSFLRPLDLLEHLTLYSSYISTDQFAELEDIFDSHAEIDDIIKLVSVLTYIDEQLNDLFKIIFEEEMEHAKSPENIMQQLLSEIELEDMFTTSLQLSINNIVDLDGSLRNMIRILSMEFCENLEDVPGFDTGDYSTTYLFNSHLGISFISEAFKQQAYYRFSLCRMLLSFLHVLIQKCSCDLTAESITTIYVPEIVALTKSYFVIYWFSKQCALPVLPLEMTMQRLSPLKLDPVFNLRTNIVQAMTLMALFTGSSGGLAAHKALNRSYSSKTFSAEWHVSLLQYLSHFRQLVWPQNGNPLLTEWLLSSGQHLWLQQYVHLTNSWCNVNVQTRNFLLAAAFLGSGEHQKAYDLFLTAAMGMGERYILSKVHQSNSSVTNPLISYYLKIIHLFELHGGRDYVLEITNTALDTALEPATLYSIKFKHHLALGHYDKAYEALCSNPDEERKKDNLRDLVKTLLDNKELKVLMDLNYENLDTLFCNILYTRARACDTVDNVFYDFLYCYQIKKGIPHMRQAGAVMYEQAFRLKHHNTIDALEKQVKCYLAAVNALSLCNPKFAWVLIPADPDAPPEVIALPTEAGTEDKPEMLELKHKIEVVELETIKLELELVSARLKLAKFDPTYLTNALTSPGEIVVYLTTVGLLNSALSLCTKFNLPYDVIFETLARQCIILTEYEDLDAWNWLIENNLHELPTLGNNPSSVSWLMLQTYLDEYELENMSTLHKIVCQKIIRMGGYVPHWLISSYKKRNPAELLRLYLFNGRLSEAYQMAKEYLLAAMGHGCDHYNIKVGVGPTSQHFCLPVNTIDALIYELHLQNEDEQPAFEKEYKDLKEMFIKYLDTTARISNEICRSAR